MPHILELIFRGNRELNLIEIYGRYLNCNKPKDRRSIVCSLACYPVYGDRQRFMDG